MKHTQCQKTFLLADRINETSDEVDLIRSTWEAFRQGKTFTQKELQEIFLFDFSDIIPKMKWDQTSNKQ